MLLWIEFPAMAYDELINTMIFEIEPLRSDEGGVFMKLVPL